MEIKETQGQTLLTLLRVAICGIACLCVFGFHGLAESFFGIFTTAVPMTSAEQTSSSYGDSYILYYDQSLKHNAYLHIYRQYYLSGSEDHVGLVDSAGKVILEQKYQGIVVLPESYILKENDKWRFYTHDMEPLTDNEWDSVELSLSEKGKLNSDLVKICSDGLYGAVNMQGEVAVSPRWDSLELYTRTAEWQLLRVSSNGDFGYIYPNGNTAVRIRYDYVQTGIYGSEEEGDSAPVIFVCDDGDWGGIFKNRYNEPGSVDWSVEPTAEVLEDYNGQNAPAE